MQDHKGILIISLDFELNWGLRDSVKIEAYKENILGARTAIPKILDLFEKYGIHATWAVVGFLFAQNKTELYEFLPKKKPEYSNYAFSPYPYLKNIGNDECEDPLHYAPSLIKKIRAVPGQEIGSHTFSHYYCMEDGQTAECFVDDLASAKKIAESRGVSLESLVFPRNQSREDYLEVCRELGLKCYRGNEKNRSYESSRKNRFALMKRAYRLADSYVNLSGHNCYNLNELEKFPVLNLPSSKFLRPYNRKLRFFESLKIMRITDSLDYAAKTGAIYHLWWHPHNFGKNIDKNLEMLERILKHYEKLKAQGLMESLNMRETADATKQQPQEKQAHNKSL